MAEAPAVFGRILRGKSRRRCSKAAIAVLRSIGRRTGLRCRSPSSHRSRSAHQVLARVVVELPKRIVGLIVHYLDRLSASLARHACDTAARDRTHSAPKTLRWNSIYRDGSARDSHRTRGSIRLRTRSRLSRSLRLSSRVRAGILWRLQFIRLL